MKTLLFLLLICGFSEAFAQSNPFMNDANGRPLYLQSNYNAEGNPYLSEKFATAHITVDGGKTYRDMQVRINLLEPQVEYKNGDGREMISLLPITKLTFPILATDDDLLFNVTYVAINGSLNSPGSAVYQLLDSGKISLLNRIIVTVKDEKKYGDASVTRTYRKIETLYTYNANGTATEKLDRSRSGILELMKDKSGSINKYIVSNKINFKKQKDLIGLFNYYNSLGK